MKYILLLLFMMFPLSAGAEIFAASEYLSELQKVEKSKRPLSMENLYARGQEVCDELADSLDGMDEREIIRSSNTLRGVNIWTSEPSGAGVNAAFMLALARRNGKKADREFFSIIKDERRPRGGDVYTTPFTDLSGCSALGSGVFVKFYGRWAGFKAKYPESYSDAAQEAMQNIEDALRRASCICGGREKALEELKTFMESFPETPAMEDLAERSVQFRKSAGGITFDCKQSAERDPADE